MKVTVIKHLYRDVEIPDFESSGDAAEWAADNWREFDFGEGACFEIELIMPSSEHIVADGWEE